MVCGWRLLLVSAAATCAKSMQLGKNWHAVSLPERTSSKRYGLGGQAQWSYPALAANPDAARKSAGELVASGEAIISVPDLVTAAECEALARAGCTVVRDHYESFSSAPGLVRLPLKTAGDYSQVADAASRAREACRPALTSAEDLHLAETILLRVLNFVDTELATLVRSQFHAPHTLTEEAPTGLVELYGARELEFTPSEPAVNIYSSGGAFAPHKDYQALTALVTLSSPDSFQGGGTGFWSHADSADDLTPTPTLVMRPPRGTVLLFGGGVMHTGIQLESGSRAVLVASFSNKQFKPPGGFGRLFE